MSRAYQRQPATSTSRATAAARSPQRPAPATSLTRAVPAATRATRGAGRGTTTVAGRGRTVAPPPARPTRTDDPYRENERTNQPERTVHVGGGYQMFTPSTAKREQMRRQAEIEQREYEAHVERSRPRGIHEVHRLGGDAFSEEEVRRRQAEKYRVEKFTRLEKTHQNQNQKKQEEEREIETKKQAARYQSMENEKRDQDLQLRSMRSTVNPSDQAASGWTDEARERDRQDTMNRFLDRFTIQNTDHQDDDNVQNHTGKDHSEQLAILREMLPHVDDQTLLYHLEVYDGNTDAIVRELLH